MAGITRARHVGARELKTRLGTYLRQVKKGVTLVVTERGEPVAELRPLQKSTAGEGARLDELVSAAMLTRESNGPLRRIRPISNAGRPVSDAVVEDREDRL